MNWRRGLLLAGIHLLVAVPLILKVEEEEAAALRRREVSWAEAKKEAASRPPQAANLKSVDTNSAGETVSLDPCTMLAEYPIQTTVEQAATYSSLLLTGWRVDCPPKWSIAAKLHTDVLWVPTLDSQRSLNAAHRRADRISLVILFVQWFLAGTFPLLRSRYWWAEPGMFITLCIAAAGVLALIPAIAGLARVPALGAMLAWFWYFLLLLWKPVHLAWRSTLPRLRRLS